MAATLSSSDTSQRTQDLVAGGCQLVCGRTKRGLIDVRDDDRGPEFGERACGGKTHAGASTRHECYLSSEVVVGFAGLDSPSVGVVWVREWPIPARRTGF
jgi:hypothetical protein